MLRKNNLPFQMALGTSDEREDDTKWQDYLEEHLLWKKHLHLFPKPQGVSFPHQNYGMQLMNLTVGEDIPALML